MRYFVRQVLLAVLLFAGSKPLLHAGEGAVYTRNREGGRRGYYGGQYGVHSGGNFGGYGFYGYQPIVTGNWYARPYPYHFDYYRYRWNAPAPQPANDCPCAAE